MALNPYSAPVPSANSTAEIGCGPPLQFGGSISDVEGQQIQRLIKGQSGHTSNHDFLTTSQIVWCGLGLLLLALFAAESLVYDELDQMFDVGLGAVALIGGLAAAYYHRSVAIRVRSELKQRSTGVFTIVAGRMTDSGIEYLIEDYPIRYQWEDFVGCRVSPDTAILYLEYPSQLNFVAASLFDSQDQWESAKAIIETNVPALGKMARLQARSPSPVVNHIAAGVKALEKNEWQTALREFNHVLALRPNESQALKGRAVATVALGDSNATLSVVDEALQFGVSDATIRQIRASALCDLQRYEEALDDLDWLLQKDAQNPDWLCGRSLAYCKLERYSEAVNDATAALEIRADQPIALNNRGFARLKLGEVDKAIADLEAAIKLAPNLDRPRELLDTARQISAGA